MSKILVIEDEALTRDMFQDCLEAEGFQTLGAEDGLTGIELARQHLPNLVLCDVVIPKLDGYAVLSQLRQVATTATIPFIFITARIGKVDRRQGMSLGADDYLTKPSTVEELLETVSARLERSAMLQSYYTTGNQPSKATVASEVRDNPTGTLYPTGLTSRRAEQLCLMGRGIPRDKGTKSVGGDRQTDLLFPTVPELSELFEFIEANYDKGITLCDVAKAVGYSPAYLTNKVKQETGRTVNRWIIERRMAQALFLLDSTDRSVEQIATTVGYQNTCHFFRQFRQYQGTTPQAWRKKDL